MPAARDPQALDPQYTQRLPYHFAKRHGVISARQLGGGVELWVRPGVSSVALAEVQRSLGQAITLCA
jgi:general secretion pathway protein E